MNTGDRIEPSGIRGRISETGKHTLIFGIGAVIQQAVSFLLLPLYTQYLTPSDYGVVNMLLILRTLVFTLSASMIGPALFRSYYDYDTEDERILVASTSIVFCFISSILVFFIGDMFSEPISSLLTGSIENSGLTTIVLLSGVFQSLNVVAMSIFRAKKWSVKYTIVSLTGMVSSLVMIIYLVMFREMGIAGVIYGGLAGTAASTILGLFIIRDNLSLRFSFSEIRKMSKYGLPMIPVNIMNFLYNSGTRIIIQSFLGNSGVGIFALGRRLGGLVQVLIIQPFNQIAPASIFSAEKDPLAKKFYARLLTYYMAVTVFVSLLIAVLASDILHLMSNQEYWNASRIVPWISVAAIFYGARGLVSLGLFLKRKTSWFPLAFGLGAGLGLALMVILIPITGSEVGAAMGLLAGNILICFIRYRAGQKIYRIRFEYGRLAKVVLSAGIVYLLTSMIGQAEPLTDLAVKGLISLIGFPVLLLVLRFPGKGELRFAKDIWGRVSSSWRG